MARTSSSSSPTDDEVVKPVVGKTYSPDDCDSGDVQSMLWDNRDDHPQLFDCILVTEDGGRPRCCKKDLAVASSFFRAMFRSGWSEMGSPAIPIKQVPMKALEAVVGYSYMKELDVTAENVGEICRAAHMLAFSDALRECVWLMGRRWQHELEDYTGVLMLSILLYPNGECGNVCGSASIFLKLRSKKPAWHRYSITVFSVDADETDASYDIAKQ